MSDETQTGSDTPPVTENTEQQATSNKPSFTVRGQYIKDLSFESPNAPQSLMTPSRPEMEVNVDLKATKLQDDLFETSMQINVRARQEGMTIFLVELAYAGIFQIANVPEDRLEPLLLVDCPFVLFPFARRVISDVSRDGGFPPLMLDPIDFHSLYLRNRQPAENTPSNA